MTTTQPLHGTHLGRRFWHADLRGRLLSGVYIRCDFRRADLGGRTSWVGSLIVTFVVRAWMTPSWTPPVSAAVGCHKEIRNGA